MAAAAEPGESIDVEKPAESPRALGTFEVAEPVRPLHLGHTAGEPSPPPARAWTWRELFAHEHPDDPARHIGLGHPLRGTSWRNRPFYASWFVGTLFGDDLRPLLGQDDGLFGGYRLGWDYSHFFGVEGRFGFANLDLESPLAIPQTTARNWFWDVQLQYYPWGDSRIRPVFRAGLGLANFRFRDELARGISETAVQLPWGIGLKYQYRRWLALRADFTDNISFSSGAVSSLNSPSLTLGAEFRFGGRPTLYY